MLHKLMQSPILKTLNSMKIPIDIGFSIIISHFQYITEECKDCKVSNSTALRRLRKVRAVNAWQSLHSLQVFNHEKKKTSFPERPRSPGSPARQKLDRSSTVVRSKFNDILTVFILVTVGGPLENLLLQKIFVSFFWRPRFCQRIGRVLPTEVRLATIVQQNEKIKPAFSKI